MFGDFLQFSEELFEPVALDKVIRVRCLHRPFAFVLFAGQRGPDMQIWPGFLHY